MAFRSFLNSLEQDFQGGGFNHPPGQTPPFYGAPRGYSIPAPPTAADNTCPREIPQAGFTDWMVLLVCPSFPPFHVCPHCYNVQVRPTPFVDKFGPRPVPSQLAIRCDLSRFWVSAGGVALYSFNEDRRLDISVLPRLMIIAVPDGECPNARAKEGLTLPLATQRNWYTIRDTQGTLPVKEWTVCMHCVVNIQTIFPAIALAFVPVAAGPMMGNCAMIPGDNILTERNAKLIHSMAECKDKTSQAGQLEMTPLVDAIRSDGKLMPYSLCPRNVASLSLRCHTMREIPELTVCEGCYSTVIKPAVQNGVDLAKRIDPMASTFPGGFTCQLYSERMRHMWAEAVYRGDIDFLRQKVTERRMKERQLQMMATQVKSQNDMLLMQMGLAQAQGAVKTEVEMGRVLNNFTLDQMGYVNQVGPNTYVPLDTTFDLSAMNRAQQQGAGIQMQVLTLDQQMKLANEDWRRNYE